MTTQATNESEPGVTLHPDEHGHFHFADGSWIERRGVHPVYYAHCPGALTIGPFPSEKTAALALSERGYGPSSRPSAPTSPPADDSDDAPPVVPPDVVRTVKARVVSRRKLEPLPIGDDKVSAPTSPGDGPTVRMLGPEDSWNVPSPPRGQTPETGGREDGPGVRFGRWPELPEGLTHKNAVACLVAASRHVGHLGSNVVLACRYAAAVLQAFPPPPSPPAAEGRTDGETEDLRSPAAEDGPAKDRDPRNPRERLLADFTRMALLNEPAARETWELCGMALRLRDAFKSAAGGAA